MLIKLKSPLPVLVTMSNIFVPICNRFHTRRANRRNNVFLRGYLSLTPSFEDILRTQGHEISSR